MIVFGQVAGYFTQRGRSGRRVIEILHCFGGGIFFGTYLLHMAPEVRVLLERSWLRPNSLEYPYPELFMGVGFFLVLYLEKLLKTISSKTGKQKTELQRDERNDGSDNYARNNCNNNENLSSLKTRAAYVKHEKESIENSTYRRKPCKVCFHEKTLKDADKPIPCVSNSKTFQVRRIDDGVCCSRQIDDGSRQIDHDKKNKINDNDDDHHHLNSNAFKTKTSSSLSTIEDEVRVETEFNADIVLEFANREDFTKTRKTTTEQNIQMNPIFSSELIPRSELNISIPIIKITDTETEPCSAESVLDEDERFEPKSNVNNCSDVPQLHLDVPQIFSPQNSFHAEDVSELNSPPEMSIVKSSNISDSVSMSAPDIPEKEIENTRDENLNDDNREPSDNEGNFP